MRCRDWSSDVCSSDLPRQRCGVAVLGAQFARAGLGLRVLFRIDLPPVAVAQPGVGAVSALGGDGHPGERQQGIAHRAGAVVVHAREDRLRLLVAMARGTPEAQVGLLVATFGTGALADDAPADVRSRAKQPPRSEEHTSELQSLMRISYAVFCLKKKKQEA